VEDRGGSVGGNGWVVVGEGMSSLSFVSSISKKRDGSKKENFSFKCSLLVWV